MAKILLKWLAILLLIFTIVSIAYGDAPKRAIQASEVLAKIKAGEPVEYDHVIIIGNLNLSLLDLKTEDIEWNDVRWLPVNDTMYNVGILPRSKRMLSINSPIRINDSCIDGEINFDDSIFYNSINFENSEFNRTASFSDSTFNGDANFARSRFNECTDFFSSRFNGLALFFESRFNKRVRFIGSQFNKSAFFDGSRYAEDAEFEWSRFKEQARFNNILFDKNALFYYCEFTDSAYFISSNFKSRADFSNSIYKGPIVFSGSSINELFIPAIEFTRLLIDWESIKKIECDSPTYRALIDNFKNQEKYDDADSCYYEYRWQNTLSSPNFLLMLFDIISLISCGYGVRWVNTIICAGAIIFLFSIYYSIYLNGNLKEALSLSAIVMLSLPLEWRSSKKEDYAKLIEDKIFLITLERLNGWGLMILFIGTLSRIMVRY